MEECEQWAREKGCSELVGDCELGSAASLSFHLLIGFQEQNRIICYCRICRDARVIGSTIKMDNLSRYDNTTVRILCAWGEVLTGACEWNPPDYGLSVFGREEESLKIGEAVTFASQIREIELLREEVCVPVRDWPEAKDEISLWFSEKGLLPPEVCRQSIRDCIGRERGLPQWYVVVRGSRIIAGCGVVENHAPARKDLGPEVCALYVEEGYRGQGVAGFLLQFVSDDMAGLGFQTLVLRTDQGGFLKRYGWTFHCLVRGEDGKLSPMYAHHGRKGADPGPDPLP